jgi:hypothetical protein
MYICASYLEPQIVTWLRDTIRYLDAIKSSCEEFFRDLRVNLDLAHNPYIALLVNYVHQTHIKDFQVLPTWYNMGYKHAMIRGSHVFTFEKINLQCMLSKLKAVWMIPTSIKCMGGRRTPNWWHSRKQLTCVGVGVGGGEREGEREFKHANSW